MNLVATGTIHEKFVIARAIALGLFLAGIDQLTKAVIIGCINPGTKIQVIPALFNITHITNPGAAWGILSGKGTLLLFISGAVFMAAIFFMRTLCEGWKERYYAVFMVLSGILGNSIDRVFRGEVVDFLDFHILNKHWPSFNVADSCICVGVAVYIISSIFRPQPRPKQPYVTTVKH